MSQANADLDTIDWDAIDQADAGPGAAPIAAEARASEVSSEHHAAHDDALAAVDPGRVGDSVEPDDDAAALAAYYAEMEDVVSAGPGEDEINPPKSDVKWGDDAYADERRDPYDDPASPDDEEDPAPVQSLPAAEEDDDDAQGRDPQFRVRPRNEIESLAFRFFKADDTLDMEGALALAKQRLGVTEVTSSDADPDAFEDYTAQPAGTVADLEKQIRELRREKIEATRAYDVDKAADLEEQLLALEEQIPFVWAREEQEAEQRRAEDEAWNQAARSNIELVRKAFPVAADPNSAFFARMTQIDEAWGDAMDQRFDDPQKPLLLAQIVAKEMGLSPATAGKGARTYPAPASSRSTAAPRPGSMAVFSPASGAARTTSEPTAVRQERAIESISDPDDYHAMVEALSHAG
jgi:hypothetical protein